MPMLLCECPLLRDSAGAVVGLEKHGESDYCQLKVIGLSEFWADEVVVSGVVVVVGIVTVVVWNRLKWNY